MWHFLVVAKPYLEPCQTIMMKCFVKIVKDLRTPSKMSNKVLSPVLVIEWSAHCLTFCFTGKWKITFTLTRAFLFSFLAYFQFPFYFHFFIFKL